MSDETTQSYVITAEHRSSRSTPGGVAWSCDAATARVATALRTSSTILAALVLVLAGCAAGDRLGAQQGSVAVTAENIPKIDVHAHYSYARDYLVPLLDEWNMKAVAVNVFVDDPAEARADWEVMKAHAAEVPGHLILCTSFDASRFDESDFAQKVIAGLEEDLAAGAQMVKVWKNIGMVYKDASGEFIQIDDPRFQPIWDFLAAEGVPVLAHIGEPRVAWLPLGEDRPHAGYFRNHPEYHAYQIPEMPGWEEIMAARDRWLARNPDLTVLGAHMGSMAYDVDEVARRLDRFPNFYVDTAARFVDLADQDSDKVRDFFIRYQDRILYGTDIGTHGPAEETTEAQRQDERARIEKMLALHWTYLTGDGELYFDSPMSGYQTTTHALALPREVVEKVYHQNAARVLAR